MEALAAVGLAGNVVQFVDFSCKLFDQASSIYQSLDGATQGNRDLESITQNLHDMSAKLYQNIPKSAATQKKDDPLVTLAKECENVANELLAVLQSLKAKKVDSQWSSFRAALRSVWKEQRVQALEKKLGMYRSQIIFQLQVLQR